MCSMSAKHVGKGRYWAPRFPTLALEGMANLLEPMASSHQGPQKDQAILTMRRVLV